MQLKPIAEVTTAGEAEQIAMDFQTSITDDMNPSYSELAEYQDYFQKLADKFQLGEVFKENGII